MFCKHASQERYVSETQRHQTFCTIDERRHYLIPRRHGRSPEILRHCHMWWVISLPSVYIARTNTHPGKRSVRSRHMAVLFNCYHIILCLFSSPSFVFFSKKNDKWKPLLQFCWSCRHCVQKRISTMAAVNIAMSEAPSLQQECLCQKGDRIKKIRGVNEGQICEMCGRLRPSSRSRLGPRNECVRRKRSAQDVQC